MIKENKIKFLKFALGTIYLRFELWNMYYAYQIRKLIERLDIQREDTIVDFGCGEFMRFKNYIKGNYIGIDIKEPLTKRGNFIKCDFNKDFPDIRFEKGILILSMEFIKNYDFFIKMLSDRISNNGKLFFVIPNFKSEHYQYWKMQDLKKKTPTSNLQSHITISELNEELYKNGFNVIEEGGIFAYPFSKGFRYPFFLRFIPIIKDLRMISKTPIDKMSYHYLIVEKRGDLQ